ncbi:hypothetical protein BH09PSE2_BH09PSE2_07980 [soil metagenome]
MDFFARIFPPTAFELARPEDWIALLARVAVGLYFAISGAYKLFSPAQAKKMRNTVAEAGIAAPRETAGFVSACELLFGALLVIGLLTPVAAVVVLIISVVALVTVTAKTVEGVDFAYRLSSFLGLPETLLIVLAAWIAVHGPTGASVDALLFKAL